MIYFASLLNGTFPGVFWPVSLTSLGGQVMFVGIGYVQNSNLTPMLTEQTYILNLASFVSKSLVVLRGK